MRLLFFLTLISFGFFSHADEKKNLSDYQTLDMKQFDGLSRQTQKKSDLKIVITCKSEDGREIKATDSEYTDCLNKSKNKITK